MSKDDPRHILVQVAEQAKALTGAETSVVALAEDEGEIADFTIGVGKHAEWITGRRGPAEGSGLCGTAFVNQEPVLVCQTKGDSRVRQDHAELLNIESALAVSLRQEGRLLGAMLLLNRADGQPFTTEDEATLKQYAPEAARQVAEYLAGNLKSKI